MKYSKATLGRTFVVRLEDGDTLHECVERLAKVEGVSAAAVLAVGGADSGSRLVVGPRRGRATPVVPMEHVLRNVHEVLGTGTLFPNRKGEPILHMHLACGRGKTAAAGCVRRGVKVWHVLELVILELLHTPAKRLRDSATGFDLLQP
jgi:predicted DNA-binding protein with PD1-like motif